MSDEHWDYFWAERDYHALLSQGKYCPKEKLDAARLTADLALSRLHATHVRRDMIAVIIVTLIACCCVGALIYQAIYFYQHWGHLP